jgi:hypothetical protein
MTTTRKLGMTLPEKYFFSAYFKLSAPDASDAGGCDVIV